LLSSRTTIGDQETNSSSITHCTVKYGHEEAAQGCAVIWATRQLGK